MSVDPSILRRTLEDVQRQRELYAKIIQEFEHKYQCSLETFEAKLEAKEVPKHPSWEDSIEWGIALDELNRLRVTAKALEWILNISGCPD